MRGIITHGHPLITALVSLDKVMTSKARAHESKPLFWGPKKPAAKAKVAKQKPS